ncbi:MAG: DUF1616 domain-containing protein [Methanobacterium sp.]|uniref:DUF1616 domain-containing protein n=1 Tax=Methanobacterium sp. TaxID=2164 RepID=UPI0028043FE2|nr:DUF1616 domain-containing protein [uncultured Methanobacterium sp.]
MAKLEDKIHGNFNMKVDKGISILILILIIIGSIGIIYTILSPGNEKFTEFYLLGANGKAGDYPSNLTPSQTGNLTVGVINHEQETSTYKIVIKDNGQIFKEENITIKNGEKREIPIQLKLNQLGQHKIEFNLYKMPENEKVYRSLFILVNVQ